jgi:alpha-tubulin suppressor-like RCC1 family protein
MNALVWTRVLRVPGLLLISSLFFAGCGKSAATPFVQGKATVYITDRYEFAENMAIKKLVAGDNHSCILTDDGSIACWGENSALQLATGDTIDRAVPTVVNGIGEAIDVYAGGNQSCAVIMQNEQVYCWGNGQPPTLMSFSSVLGISLSAAHGCAILDDNSIQCWGDNLRGQLGNGAAVPAYSLTVGNEHSCAVSYSVLGQIQCWGDNQFGQLGNGTTSVLAQPGPSTLVSFSSEQIAAGRDFTCGLAWSDSQVNCWGANGFEQLGVAGAPSSSPQPIPNLYAFSISTNPSAQHMCAILATDQVRCWGRNTSGQVGTGGFASPAAPTTVAGLAGVVQLALGASHSCAVLSNNTVRCWGSNLSGQLGNNNPGVDSGVPVLVN